VRGFTNVSRRSPAPAVALVCTCLVSLLLAGCGLLGKPAPLSAGAAVKISVTSPELADGVIPARYTCHGPGVNPPIFWSGVPPGTKSLALVVDDSAAPISPRVYWIVFDIAPSTTYLQSRALPPHARVAQNSLGKADYDPPCPSGAPHIYRFTIYALNTVIGKTLPPDPALLRTWTTIAQHVIARGTLAAKACPNSMPIESGQCEAAT
jgi:Raf kinase inhibitor-like YbhB/YbcL family protein